MSTFIENFKRRIGQKLWLRKFPIHRKKKFLAFRDAKSLLILFDASTPEQIDQISHFIEEIKSDHALQIQAIGYAKGNNRNNSNNIENQLNIHFITRKELSFFYFPRPHKWVECLGQDFDLLMVLTSRPLFVVQLLANHVSAKMKLGKSELWNDTFDFMVATPDSIPFDQMGREMVNQLKMFQPKYKFNDSISQNA